MTNKKVVKVLPKKIFKGYSTSTMILESIKLKPDEILRFDYPYT